MTAVVWLGHSSATGEILGQNWDCSHIDTNDGDCLPITAFFFFLTTGSEEEKKNNSCNYHTDTVHADTVHAGTVHADMNCNRLIQ